MTIDIELAGPDTERLIAVFVADVDPKPDRRTGADVGGVVSGAGHVGEPTALIIIIMKNVQRLA